MHCRLACLRGRRGEIPERKGDLVIVESGWGEAAVEHRLQFPPTEEAICGAGRQECPRSKERAANRESWAVPIILRYGKNARVPLAARLALPMAGDEVAPIGGENDPAICGSEAQLRLIRGRLRALSLGGLNDVPAPGEGGDYAMGHALVKVQNLPRHHQGH